MKFTQTLKSSCLAGIIFGALISSQEGPAKSTLSAKTAQPTEAVKVNRTVPNVESPKGGLRFSAKPTVDEFFRARIFEEPLVPVGGLPDATENSALAAALDGYSKRSGQDDFNSLTKFLTEHPQSAWSAALLTNLGLEYYNTAHYSMALDAWAKAWALAKDATDPKAKAIGDRAVGELAYMYARLGRMEDMEPLLHSVEGRVFTGPATERISGARAGLSNMKDRPEIAFRCGPLALHSIKLMNGPKNAGTSAIIKSASTQKGFSLPQVAELSRQVDLNYQMAFRQKGGPIVVPSVVHWKVGHYAAIVRQEGDRYLVKDPTFQNDVWATGAALEAESSGYFLVASGKLPQGWRSVNAEEGGKVWGRGNVCCRDPNGPSPPPPPPCPGMAVSTVHLALISLTIEDDPVGYAPPVGPKVDFVVTYQQREANQPAGFNYSSFGPKWTFGWLSYVTDNPTSPSADVKQYLRGGGTRTFTGFNATTQTFAYQQYRQDKLTRTSASSYELTSPDGSKKVFGLSDDSTGTMRRVFLTQLLDPFGNAVSLTYDSLFRIVAVTDAIGQVTTIAYTNSGDVYKVTKITDPFGRFATFEYDSLGRLIKITDVIGIQSQFGYDTTSDFINAMTTPYGTKSFSKGENGTTAWLETTYPTGEKSRVEFNQSTNLGIPQSLPANQLPQGMNVHNDYMSYRNTFVWSRNAYASSYPDYTKAKIYHWCHTADGTSASEILESEKAPLEGRIWYDYAGQADSIFVGTSDRPTHVGRVLDDGSTQLFTNEYDNFGHMTKVTDPIGRVTTYTYATNGIDLLEIRQLRPGGSDLLFSATYNSQHLPLTQKDAAGQTTTFAYNARGQLTTRTNAKNEVFTKSYDGNGYVTSMDGPLPGTVDSIALTYDAYGRLRTKSDVNGYTVTLDYDNLDRVTRLAFPDNTFIQRTFTNLDLTTLRDRAGRQTLFEYDALRQLSKRTDPLGRVTSFDWCKCSDLRSLTDAKGRTTAWRSDIQGRIVEKTFPDGSNISYAYENSVSRLRQRTNERSQVTRYAYNVDNTVRNISYTNTSIATPAVSFGYDPSYRRTTSMTDGTGTTRYSYVPVTNGTSLGAWKLASVDGPLPNDTITYGYDELGRGVSRAINGVAFTVTFNAAGKVTNETNALGSFTETYDAASYHQLGENGPNGQTMELAYGDNLHNELLQRITNKRGATMLSEFLETHDSAHEGRLTSWSQQAGAATPSVYTLGYNDDNELTSVSITNATPNTFAYTYDTAANRLTETIGAVTTTANFNALNELTTLNGSATAVTNEWDAEQRLTAVNSGNERTEFTYDGLGRRVQIRKLVNSLEVSNRRFVWCDDEICEERDVNGAVTKRYFPQGMKIETGAAAGVYFYTRDHLHSIRELIDNTGAVRARYSYDPYGRRTKVTGDLEADFGFTGMFWSPETSLGLTKFRAYDAGIGRWLSRDPLYRAELRQGPNLYGYVGNNPINLTDPLGLQNVGPKAPPGAPAPDLPGQPGIGCVDPGDALEGIGNCIQCIMSFFPGEPGDPFTPGDSCVECLSIPPLGPCPPPPPPGPDCNSIPLMEGVPPPCSPPKPPCPPPRGPGGPGGSGS